MTIQRLTDQNFIPLAKSNAVIDKKEYVEFSKEFIAVPEEELKEKLEELTNKKLKVLYQVLPNKNECVTLGVDPNVPYTDVIAFFVPAIIVRDCV